MKDAANFSLPKGDFKDPKSSIWAKLHADYPELVETFCNWVDEFKKRSYWTQRFGLHLKFHDLPIAMQFGVFMQFTFETSKQDFGYEADSLDAFITFAKDGIEQYFQSEQQARINDGDRVPSRGINMLAAGLEAASHITHEKTASELSQDQYQGATNGAPNADVNKAADEANEYKDTPTPAQIAASLAAGAGSNTGGLEGANNGSKDADTAEPPAGDAGAIPAGADKGADAGQVRAAEKDGVTDHRSGKEGKQAGGQRKNP